MVVPVRGDEQRQVGMFGASRTEVVRVMGLSCTFPDADGISEAAMKKR